MADKTAVKEVVDRNTIRIPGEVLRIVLCEKFNAPVNGSMLIDHSGDKVSDAEMFELTWERHRVAVNDGQ